MSRATFAYLLGTRNWHNAHLGRCLASIRRITDDPAVVADLGSERASADQVAALCGAWGATFVSHQHDGWSRSLALNVAARRAVEVAEPIYLVLTDADMIFSPTWRRVAGDQVAPDRMLLTRTRDTTEATDLAALMDLDDHGLMARTTPHPEVGQGGGMVVPSEWYHRVGGMDEYYKTWGAEDTDLVWRAHWSGLGLAWLEGSFVVHQWHRRDWATEEDWAQVRANRAYLAERIRERGPVARNPGGWGGVPLQRAEKAGRE